jgi:hypothetical protein
VMGAFIVDLQEQEAWHSLILHYIKIWHPWFKHIQLVSQSSHRVLDALGLCHFYDYSHILNFNMCAIDLVWPNFLN